MLYARSRPSAAVGIVTFISILCSHRLCADTQPYASAGAPKRALTDPVTFVYNSTSGQLVNKQLVRNPGIALNRSSSQVVNGNKFWTLAQLKRSILVPGWEQFRPVLDKLNRGEPISVVGFGSSVTENLAGCYNRGGVEVVRGRIRHTPIQYTRSDQPCGCEDGWAAMFMQYVNAHWPHPDHLFINAGRTATTLRLLLDGGCSEDMMPWPLDMVILETTLSEQLEVETEQLIYRFLHLPITNAHPPIFNFTFAANLTKADVEVTNSSMAPFFRPPRAPHAPPRAPAVVQQQQRPAIAVMSTAYAVARPGGNMSYTMENCVRSGACSTDCPGSSFEHLIYSEYSSAVPSDRGPLRTPGLLWLAQYYGIGVISLRQFYATAFQDGTLNRINKSECEMLSSLLSDYVHPRPLGRHLMADMLATLVFYAHKHLQEFPDMQPLDIPPRPFFKGGWDMHLKRCYMRDYQGQEFETPGVDSHLQVVSNNGWRFVEYSVHGNNRKYKPGFLSTTPGSHLTFEVDSTFKVGRPNTTQLVLGYLVSYSHMGWARLECVAGCACNAIDLNGHRNSDHMASFTEMQGFQVTPSPRCHVRLTVLPKTDSGENKFKLITVVVRALAHGVGTLVGAPS